MQKHYLKQIYYHRQLFPRIIISINNIIIFFFLNYSLIGFLPCFLEHKDAKCQISRQLSKLPLTGYLSSEDNSQSFWRPHDNSASATIRSTFIFNHFGSWQSILKFASMKLSLNIHESASFWRPLGLSSSSAIRPDSIWTLHEVPQAPPSGQNIRSVLSDTESKNKENGP